MFSYRGGYEDIDDSEYEEDDKDDEKKKGNSPVKTYVKSNQQQSCSWTETPRQRPRSDFSASPSRQIGGGDGGLKDSSDDGAARIQWMITQKMRSGLLRLNYLPDEIKEDPHVAKILLERRLFQLRTGMPISWRRKPHRQLKKNDEFREAEMDMLNFKLPFSSRRR